MANWRELIEVKENGVTMWTCGACGWVRAYPRFATQQNFLGAFNEHVCAEHPKPKKPREDVNQAAARIVREATERV